MAEPIKIVIMNRNFILLLILIFSNNILVSAQTGFIKDKDSNSISYATVQLLSLPDSAFVAGTVSDREGKFTLNTRCPLEGLCMKISFVGYQTKIISPVRIDMGTIT